MALVNYENVVEAAEALIANGQKASVRNVIKQIGGGSPNAVLKYLGEYKAGRPVIRVADVDLDPSIVAAIKRQMQSVAVDATTAAEERAASLTDDLQTLAESNQSLEQQVELLNVDLSASAETVQTLVASREFEKQTAAREIALAQSKLAELTRDLHDERKRSAAAQVELGKLQSKADAVPLLEAAIEKLQNELKAEGAARTAAEQRAAVADAQAKLINDQVATTATAAEKVAQEHKDAIAQLRQDLADARQAARDAAAELKSARAQIDALRDAAAAGKPVVEPATPAPKKSK